MARWTLRFLMRSRRLVIEAPPRNRLVTIMLSSMATLRDFERQFFARSDRRVGSVELFHLVTRVISIPDIGPPMDVKHQDARFKRRLAHAGER